MAVPNRKERRRLTRDSKRPSAPGGGAPGAGPALQTLLNRALALHRANRFQDALQTYRRILAVDPDNAEALNFAGVASFQIGDIAGALTRLRRAVTRRPTYAEAYGNLGNVLRASGRLEEAEAAYRRAIAIKPDHAGAHYNLGLLLQSLRRYEASTMAYRRTIEIDPDHAGAHTNLSAVLSEIGDLERAVAAARRAIAGQPRNAEAHNNLGIALWAAGDFAAAETALRRAIEIDPRQATAHLNLGQVLYRETGPEKSVAAFEKALLSDPGLGMARFYLGVILDRHGDAETAARHFAELARHPKKTDHLIDSWTYVKRHSGPATCFHGNTFETLTFALDQARVDGLVLEFGVRFGLSINFIARHSERKVHGFDSFQGLPEAWDGVQSGLYSTGGRLPEVEPNVRLHVGWFDEALPRFTAEHGAPVRFMNVDCDIYSSTRTVFAHLAERIVPGTVIVFDEYLVNPNWREDEFKAFQEVVEARSWSYEYIAFNIFSKQAAVRIL